MKIGEPERLLMSTRSGIVITCVNLELVMPKLKTRKSAAKRFKVTGTGKIMRRNPFRAHLLEHKSPGRKRRLAGMSLVFEGDAANVRTMLPYL